MILGEDKWLLFTGRRFWNRKCRKKTWWQQEFAVFKCEATANSVTGHVCVNSNTGIVKWYENRAPLLAKWGLQW